MQPSGRRCPFTSIRERGSVEHRGKAHSSSVSSGCLPSCPPPGGHLYSGYRAWPPTARGPCPPLPWQESLWQSLVGLGAAALNSLSPPGTSRKGAMPRTSSSRFGRSLETQPVCRFLEVPAHALHKAPALPPERKLAEAASPVDEPADGLRAGPSCLPALPPQTPALTPLAPEAHTRAGSLRP